MIGDMIFTGFVVGSIALTVVLLARPWELPGASMIDRLRIAQAVWDYDFWLGWFGVGGRARRDARAELRANLWDAGQRVGVSQAIAAIGPLRPLARAAAGPATGPRWGWGILAGFVALELVIGVQLLAMTVAADTARAAAATRLEVPLTLLPGTTVTYSRLGEGVAVSLRPGPAPVVLGVVAFLVVARPWRWRRRAARRTPTGAAPTTGTASAGSSGAPGR